MTAWHLTAGRILTAKATAIGIIVALVAVSLAATPDADSGLYLIDRYGLPLVVIVFCAFGILYWLAPWVVRIVDRIGLYFMAQLDEAKRERVQIIDQAKIEREKIHTEFIRVLDDQRARDKERTQEMLQQIVSHITHEVGSMTTAIVKKIDSPKVRQTHQRKTAKVR